ncbi:TULIP family P47-like protein [Kitasatospora paranensis]|uniref:TULIP family P47-like protein n=1 Tax=Kitasatospora paranensis TaxID=258053 RepID=A0ABW2G332_9ACTN
MSTVHELFPHLTEDQVVRLAVELAEPGGTAGTVRPHSAPGALGHDAHRAQPTHRTHSTHRSHPTHRAGSVGDPGQVYSTNGWDTVYVVPLPQVNAAIAAAGSSPAAWQSSIPATDFGPAIESTGAFGTWSLTSGGSGSIIRMRVPFTADVTIENTPPHEIKVGGGVAHIEVKLHYIPQPPSDGALPHQLKVRTVGGPDDPAVTVTDVSYTSPASEVGLTTALKTLLQSWFNAHLDEFAHVFATVNLSDKEDTADAFAWLKPTTTSYAYIDGTTLQDCLLGVLCMTEHRPATKATQQLAPGAVPAGAQASFNLSVERFLTKMALPALPVAFAKATAGTFVLDDNNAEISAKQPFDLDPVRIAGLNYTPQVERLQITVEGDRIKTYMLVRTHISPGIDAYYEMWRYNTVALATKDDGTQSLTWLDAKRSGDQEPNHWVEVATWVTVTEAIAAIIVAVIGAAAAASAEAVEGTIQVILLASLVAGIAAAVAVIMAETPKWIAGTVPDAIPAIDPLVTGATEPIRWTDSTAFKITAAGINGGLQLGGTPFAG